LADATDASLVLSLLTTEAVSLVDANSAQWFFNPTVSEAISLDDAESNTAILHSTVYEELSFADIVSLPYDPLPDSIDRLTATFIFPGVDYAQRSSTVAGMLNGTILIQTWKQVETLGLFVAVHGSLPQYYRP